MPIQKGYILDDILDQSFIYSILCYKAYSFYNMLKYVFQLPIIITSSIMSIVNSNLDDTGSMRIIKRLSVVRDAE